VQLKLALAAVLAPAPGWRQRAQQARMPLLWALAQWARMALVWELVQRARMQLL
jgi:hypothetical protein